MLAGIVMMILAGPASGPVVEMTPALVQEAITLGTKEKGSLDYAIKGKRVGGVKKGLSIGGGIRCGFMSTPFSRVATEAGMAAKAYKTFGPSDVKPEMLAPVAVIYASANPTGKRTEHVSAVVLVPKRGAAVQPASFEAHAAAYSNAYGAIREGTEAVATFPVSALTDDTDIRIIYGSWECSAGIDVKKLR